MWLFDKFWWRIWNDWNLDSFLTYRSIKLIVWSDIRGRITCESIQILRFQLRITFCRFYWVGIQCKLDLILGQNIQICITLRSGLAKIIARQIGISMLLVERLGCRNEHLFIRKVLSCIALLIIDYTFWVFDVFKIC